MEENTFDLLNTPQLKEFKQTHRNAPVDNVEIKPRGGKDVFFNNYDNWIFAWTSEEESLVRPMNSLLDRFF